MSELNEIMHQVVLADICRRFHPNTRVHTLYLGTLRSLSEIDNILRYKINPNKFRTIDIISHILSDHDAMKLKIGSKSLGSTHTRGD